MDRDAGHRGRLDQVVLGDHRGRWPASRAAATRASVPATGRSEPSSASSPSSAVVARSASSWPEAASSPTPIARSCAVPFLGRSAGAVDRDASRGHLEAAVANGAPNPLSRLLHGVAGQAHDGQPRKPKATSTSTRTGTASTPRIDALIVSASTAHLGETSTIRGQRKSRRRLLASLIRRRPAGRVSREAVTAGLGRRCQWLRLASTTESSLSAVAAKSLTALASGPSGRLTMNGAPELRARSPPGTR